MFGRLASQLASEIGGMDGTRTRSSHRFSPREYRQSTRLVAPQWLFSNRKIVGAKPR